MKKKCEVCPIIFERKPKEWDARWNSRRFCSTKCANTVVAFKSTFDPKATTKICSKCKVEKSLEDFSLDRYKSGGKQPECKKCNSEYYHKHKENYQVYYKKKKQENPIEYLYKQNKRKYKHRYGITREDKQRKIDEQKSLCALCKKPLLGFSESFIDHDHKTRKIRGILHSNCNSGIGMFEDSLEMLQQAIDYLNLHNSP